MDNRVNNALNWVPTEIYYQCFFGEIKIFSIKLNGVKIAANIFELTSQVPQPARLSHHLNDRQVSHCYSLPCANDIKPGIKIKQGYIHHIAAVYRHFYVITDGDSKSDFNAYLRRFKGKTLNSLKRKINKVEQSNHQQQTFISFTNPTEVEEFLNIAKSISEKSYQEKLLHRSLPTDNKFIDKLKALAQTGNFRGYILYAEDTPIAYNLCPIYGNGIMLYDYTGYDPDYSRYSAGTVLQYKIIQQCFADPTIHAYDLCTGEGKHKEYFANGFTTCCDAYFFPARARYFLLVYSRFIIEHSARLVISILAKAGIKSRIKTFIRRLK